MFFFFFNDTATTEIYTLSLHDALPILFGSVELNQRLDLADAPVPTALGVPAGTLFSQDRKSTRLNSSHGYISYAVFCLKKKKYEVKRTNILVLPATGICLHMQPQRRRP